MIHTFSFPKLDYCNPRPFGLPGNYSITAVTVPSAVALCNMQKFQL